MTSDMVNDQSDNEREETHCCLFMGYCFQLGWGGGWVGGGTIYIPIIFEGSGMPTTRPKTGSLVQGLRAVRYLWGGGGEGGWRNY